MFGHVWRLLDSKGCMLYLILRELKGVNSGAEHKGSQNYVLAESLKSLQKKRWNSLSCCQSSVLFLSVFCSFRSTGLFHEWCGFTSCFSPIYFSGKHSYVLSTLRFYTCRCFCWLPSTLDYSWVRTDTSVLTVSEQFLCSTPCAWVWNLSLFPQNHFTQLCPLTVDHIVSYLLKKTHGNIVNQNSKIGTHSIWRDFFFLSAFKASKLFFHQNITIVMNDIIILWTA